MRQYEILGQIQKPTVHYRIPESHHKRITTFVNPGLVTTLTQNVCGFTIKSWDNTNFWVKFTKPLFITNFLNYITNTSDYFVNLGQLMTPTPNVLGFIIG